MMFQRAALMSGGAALAIGAAVWLTPGIFENSEHAENRSQVQVNDLKSVDFTGLTVSDPRAAQNHRAPAPGGLQKPAAADGITFHKIPYTFKPLRWAKVLAFDRMTRRAIDRHGPFDIVHGFTKTSRQDIYTDGSGCLQDFQAYSLSRSAWRRRLVWMMLGGGTVLPIAVYSEMWYGLLAGGVADTAGLVVILALSGMLIGVLRYTGKADAEQGEQL